MIKSISMTSEKTGLIVWRMSPLMLTTGTCWLILIWVLNLLTLMKWVTCATITIVMFIITVWSCSTVECVLPQRWNQMEESEWDLITCHTITQVLLYVCMFTHTLVCAASNKEHQLGWEHIIDEETKSWSEPMWHSITKQREREREREREYSH